MVGVCVNVNDFVTVFVGVIVELFVTVELYAGLTCQDNFLANLRWFFLSLPFCNMGPCCRQLTA